MSVGLLVLLVPVGVVVLSDVSSFSKGESQRVNGVVLAGRCVQDLLLARLRNF